MLFPRYSFAVYDIAARRCGATPVEAPDRDYAADVDTLLAALTERTRVVFLANPNNPTGSFMPKAELLRLHAGLPGDVLLVVDQAYAEYVDPSDQDDGLALAAAHGNVLATRTFSKIYGLAGERVGWATGAPALVDALNRIRGPFNVTVSGQAAAVAALADQAFVEASREHNRTVRERFVAALEALGNHGLRPVPSAANFVLVLFEGALDAESGACAVSPSAASRCGTCPARACRKACASRSAPPRRWTPSPRACATWPSARHDASPRRDHRARPDRRFDRAGGAPSICRASSRRDTIATPAVRRRARSAASPARSAKPPPRRLPRPISSSCACPVGAMGEAARRNRRRLAAPARW